MKKRRFSQGALARESGVSQSVISHVLAGEKRATADFIIKIATPLEAEPVALLRLAGILPPLPKDDSPLASEATELVRSMSEQKQRRAVSLLRWLNQESDE